MSQQYKGGFCAMHNALFSDVCPVCSGAIPVEGRGPFGPPVDPQQRIAYLEQRLMRVMDERDAAQQCLRAVREEIVASALALSGEGHIAKALQLIDRELPR